LPARRNELRSRDAWPLNVHYAGHLPALVERLQAAGWTPLPQADWRGLLMMLDDDATATTLPIMPATHEGHPEALLMVRAGATPEERKVLRLWPAPYALGDHDEPLWLGTAQTLGFATRGEGFVRYWAVQDGDDDAPARVAIDAAPLRVGEHGGVLRLRAPATGD
jgi:hypothetical protein